MGFSLPAIFKLAMAEVCGLSPKGGRGMAINRLIYLLLSL